MINAKWKTMIDLLKSDVVPATGCTEPVSLAFAAATAARELGEPVESIKARVSANLMKNGMGVMVPGTGRHGLYIAAAVGALGGDPEKGLQVLNGIDQETIEAGKHLADAGCVSIDIAYEVPHVLYAEALVQGKNHAVRACIADAHTNVVSVEKDGEVLFQAEQGEDNSFEEKQAFLQTLSILEIVEFAEQVPVEDVAFMKQAGEVNDRLSKEGLTGKYGLAIGCEFQKKQAQGLLGRDLMNDVIIRTVAASDARMGGAPLPAVTNSGSGNQGISATMPVVVVADYVKAGEEERLRAMVLSHMTAIYAHAFLPKLSALCATLTASMGAAAGMAWLLDRENSVRTISHAVCTMTGDAIGMVCDGAANSCSMKVVTSVSSAFRSVMMALDGIRVGGNDGLVAHDADECIRNVGALACRGMKVTDDEILRIMLHKNQGAC